MKTLFAVLAGASILAAPLIASAQPGANGDHRGARGGAGGGFTGGQGPAAAPAQANPGPVGGGRQGGFNRGQGAAVAPTPAPVPVNPGAAGAGRFAQPGQGGVQPQTRSFGGGNFPGRAPDRNFGGRAPNRDFGGRDLGRQNFDQRRFQGRGFQGQPNYGNRGYAYGRGYDQRSRWGVGAFLPRTYWNAYIDPFAYGLPLAPYGYHWVVVGDEALLIEDGTGAIAEVLYL
ncbi:MAG TPA: RcnB family protein [Caulobacteraceae bacterium]|jgi:Ni/Co efflux regulator RcnB|nr:RcnB family protein [Caulobacteraceae bacterium]